MNMNLFVKHVKDRLSAYCQGELTTMEVDEIGKHLAQCQHCQREYEEIKLGIQLAKQLKQPVASPLTWQKMKNLLPSTPEPHPLGYYFFARRRLIAIYAMVIIIMVMGASYFYLRQDRVHLEPTSYALTNLEMVAQTVHTQQLSGKFEAQYSTHSSRALRNWIKQQTGLNVEIYVEHTNTDQPNIQLQGAQVLSISQQPAVAIAYAVDSLPVTLVVTPAKAVNQLPNPESFSKHITYREDKVNNYKMLTWQRKEQAYTITSQLPSFGQQACFVCHDSPERRQLISSMKLD